LLIVQPATVIRWHSEGFRRYWRRRSRAKRAGRPTIEPKVIALIRRMGRENPLWGAPRIRDELALLGHELPTERPDTITFEKLRVALHGQGYADKAETRNLVAEYPTAKSGCTRKCLMMCGHGLGSLARKT
jgi:hypothetical protein